MSAFGEGIGEGIDIPFTEILPGDLIVPLSWKILCVLSIVRVEHPYEDSFYRLQFLAKQDRLRWVHDSVSYRQQSHFGARYHYRNGQSLKF